jgi:CheY-like chemotaxis protein
MIGAVDLAPATWIWSLCQNHHTTSHAKVQTGNGPILGHRKKMITSEQFEHELQEALIHLYDPDYRPSAAFCTLIGCDPENGALPVQSIIVQTIQDLRPQPASPPGARIEQMHDLLHSRYVLKLTREEAADRLHMSVSSAKRLQREAVHALAMILWERSHAHVSSGDHLEDNAARQPEEAQVPDWSSQTKHELASLRASAPDAVSDVGEVIDGVLQLVSVLAAKHDVCVEIGFLQQDLVAAIHPNVLRQVLITALGRLAQFAAAGQITIYAGLEDGNAKVTITGPAPAEETSTDDDLTRDILAPENTSIEACVEDGHVFLWLELPTTGEITTLVVDDNLDMIRFYRRSTEGTNYRVVPVTRGQDLFEMIETAPPDVIVLDVMLPDVDGWNLLLDLHEHPATRSVPVIVCSVVREENLAMSLGAALYLPKPVSPRQFIRALDQVLGQSQENIAPANRTAL